MLYKLLVGQTKETASVNEKRLFSILASLIPTIIIRLHACFSLPLRKCRQVISISTLTYSILKRLEYENKLII
jgi:hypothetical protein